MSPAYFDGRHYTEYFATREITEENFFPMCVNNVLMWETFKRDNIQVKIYFLGQYLWINVPRQWIDPKKWAQIRPY